jgi:uncharacterized damage-inducible protein DinB
MASAELLRKLFDYDHWANRAALASLSTIPGDAGRAGRYIAHIVGAQRVWLSRFETPDSPSTQPWPALTFNEAQAAVEVLHKRWVNLVDRLTPDDLAQDLAYRNTKGQEFRTPIQDVLMHLVMHSVYHRGQVAAAVREAGGKPASTDYIAYVRQLQSSGPAQRG